jgi:SOS response regulatory protein OraA/RecX
MPDFEEELKSAQEFVQKKFGESPSRDKLYRVLYSRGFSSEIISIIMKKVEE